MNIFELPRWKKSYKPFEEALQPQLKNIHKVRNSTFAFISIFFMELNLPGASIALLWWVKISVVEAKSIPTSWETWCSFSFFTSSFTSNVTGMLRNAKERRGIKKKESIAALEPTRVNLTVSTLRRKGLTDHLQGPLEPHLPTTVTKEKTFCLMSDIPPWTDRLVGENRKQLLIVANFSLTFPSPVLFQKSSKCREGSHFSTLGPKFHWIQSRWSHITNTVPLADSFNSLYA